MHCSGLHPKDHIITYHQDIVDRYPVLQKMGADKPYNIAFALRLR
jgi:hypothetical protein